jgi:crotonobetainyl-CoA:carnitine CoA-transferase CaiB-like acyl-CoA transferase
VNSREENARPRQAAPALGQHSREVLRACGFGEEQVEGLYASGAVR